MGNSQRLKLWLVSLWLLSPSVQAQEPDPQPEPEPVPQDSPSFQVEVTEDANPLTPKERLSAAIQAYQRGDRENALALLSALATDPAIEGSDLQQQSMIYLGELHFVQGDERWARRFFEEVIKSDPQYVLDPFRHPPDVAAFFNQVKLTMDLSGFEPPAPLPLQPPRAAWSPLAIYHFNEGRKGRGWAYSGTQVATGVTSIILASVLIGQHNWELGGIPYSEGDEATHQQLVRIQRANLYTFLGFYSSWTVSVVDAHRHWRTKRLEPVQSSLGDPELQLNMAIRW